jgi:pyruvate,water dikinase
MDLEQIDRTDTPKVGGKAVHLGELMRIEGIRVPDGFCVTTDAFGQALAEVPSIAEALDGLSRVAPDDRAAIQALSAQGRRAIEGVAVPEEVVSAIGESLGRFGEQVAFAVRSTATAEDMPGASFAGQHDSYLNVVGHDAIVGHVRRCWASLFSERAVSYRRRNGFDDERVRMAVLVQQMVSPRAAGILFTADPVTSSRKVATVEAVWGLGEALASGLVSADVYTVRDDVVVAGPVAPKPRGAQPSPEGGIGQASVAAKRQTLTDTQVVRLVQWGRRIEAHFGCPQDIEWCLVGDDFEFVQSRPITTLFPVPTIDDQDNHLYISVGHQQMMTDAMKPLGLSLWQLTTARPMYEAGGRLFVDVAPDLGTPAGRARLLARANSDPLIRDALQTVLDRGGFLRSLPDERPDPAPASAPIEPDPGIVTDLVAHARASVATLRREIEGLSGPALLDFILADIAELKRILFDPRSSQIIMAGMQAKWWLDEHLETWLGEKNATDTLTQSVPDNVTAEMGLALLDVADAIRPHPEVVTFLRRVAADGRDDASFLDELASLPGGPDVGAAIRNFLADYGMRCTGEIDVTRMRWSERPATLVPTILGNVKTFEPGAGQRRFAQGLHAAQQKEQELLGRLRALPDGERKADETQQMIDRVRAFAGYREYPKYSMISRYFAYKQALLREAERLFRSEVLRATDDIFYLRLHELQDVVRTGNADHELIRQRRTAFRSYQALTPPRVLTSDGETITGKYRGDDTPPGALAGLPVSSGTVEGRARIVTDMALANLEAGDILVTAYTDPSWTPLFLTAAALVTEVGSLMTHGAVIAREYGLPAVVAVHQATHLIRDRQRIRVNGTSGHVTLLD